MKTTLVIALLMSAALVACGGKAKKSTTPSNTGTQTQMGASGSATGGSTYGGTMTGSAAPMPSGGADPCAAN